MSENKHNPFDEIVDLYTELYQKVASTFKHEHKLIDRLRGIDDQVRSLQEDIEEFIDDLDRQNYNLSDKELKRIEQRDSVDRAIDRVKPLMLVSLMMESINEEKFENNDN